MNRRKEIEKAALVALVIIGVSGATLLVAWAQPRNRGQKEAALRSTIAFVSTRHDPAADPAVDPMRAWLAAEIYLMDGDGTNLRRLTENTYCNLVPGQSKDSVPRLGVGRRAADQFLTGGCDKGQRYLRHERRRLP